MGKWWGEEVESSLIFPCFYLKIDNVAKVKEGEWPLLTT